MGGDLLIATRKAISFGHRTITMKNYMATKIIIIALFAALISMGKASAQQVNGPTILKKMLEAETRVSFTARQVTTISKGPVRTSEQIIWRSGLSGMRLEFVRPAGLRGEIMADDGKTLSHYLPKENTVKTRPSRLASMKARIAQIARAFKKREIDVQMLGRDKVAGRSAYIVQISPKLRRQGDIRKIWIDSEKWVKLRTDDIAPNGKLISSSYYTSIDFVDSIPNEKFRIDKPAGARVERDPIRPGLMSIDKLQRLVGFQIMKPSYLPDGFKLVGGTVRPFRGGKLVVLRYSDGVNSFSLFQTPARMLNPKFMERLHRDPSRAGVDTYTWQSRGSNLTIVGSITQEQVHRVADSVR